MSVHGLPPMQPALTCLRLAPTRSLDDRTFELRKNAKRLDRTPRRPGWWCRSPLVQIHAAGRLMPASNARSPRPAQPTYLRLSRTRYNRKYGGSDLRIYRGWLERMLITANLMMAGDALTRRSRQRRKSGGKPKINRVAWRNPSAVTGAARRDSRGVF
jgi:hypothetical protein